MIGKHALGNSLLYRSTLQFKINTIDPLERFFFQFIIRKKIQGAKNGVMIIFEYDID